MGVKICLLRENSRLHREITRFIRDSNDPDLPPSSSEEFLKWREMREKNEWRNFLMIWRWFWATPQISETSVEFYNKCSKLHQPEVNATIVISAFLGTNQFFFSQCTSRAKTWERGFTFQIVQAIRPAFAVQQKTVDAISFCCVR